MNRALKNIGKTALLLLLASSCLFAEKPSPDVEKAISAAESQWRQAVLAGSRSVLASLMADDITYTHSSSLTQTKNQFIESVVSGSTKYQGIDFQTTQMRQYGDAVIITHDAIITTVQTGWLTFISHTCGPVRTVAGRWFRGRRPRSRQNPGSKSGSGASLANALG